MSLEFQRNDDRIKRHVKAAHESTVVLNHKGQPIRIGSYDLGTDSLTLPVRWVEGDVNVFGWPGSTRASAGESPSISILGLAAALERSTRLEVGESMMIDTGGATPRELDVRRISQEKLVVTTTNGVSVELFRPAFLQEVEAFARDVRSYLLSVAPELATDLLWGWWFAGRESRD